MSNDSPRTRRVASPSPPAKAIQIRAIPRPNAPSTEDRFAARDFRVDRDVDRADGPLRAGKARRRERLFELPADRGGFLAGAPELLRDRGGEDARVAMMGGYAITAVQPRVTRRREGVHSAAGRSAVSLRLHPRR